MAGKNNENFDTNAFCTKPMHLAKPHCFEKGVFYFGKRQKAFFKYLAAV